MSEINALVVDDSSTSRMLLTKILRKMDIHCEQASSGEDAISQLSWYHPNFIFLDHIMPGMDGFETLKVIKSRPDTKNIPVIMYTSQHAHKYYEEAHTLGAAGVISKQVDRDKLYLMINRLCINNANNLNEHAEQDVPTVYQEVQKNLEATINDFSNSKILARISTLETAYEELHDENRGLKLELSQTKTEQENWRLKSQNISIPQIFITLFLALALFGSTFTWFTTQKIEREYVSTQKRIGMINELIDDIIDFLENNKDN
ncbi:MAG: CheY-like chemotaxis protein [Oleiphilaceae bacterium]